MHTEKQKLEWMFILIAVEKQAAHLKRPRDEINITTQMYGQELFFLDSIA